MRNVLLSSLLTAAIVFAPTAAEAQVDARIWLENEPEYFRRGDRMQVSFSVGDDAYVAVVHVDTDGNMDFVYPSSPWDNEWVRGRQVHSLAARGGGSPWMVRGRGGIGYFYIIASPDPLDFEYFRGRTGSPWDWGYAGRVVQGDPFVAFDQIARMLMPGYPYTPYVYDYYSYYVDGVHRYPTYACSDRYFDNGWGWTPSYGSCGQLDYFLRDNPYYYDTRRYRGDRRVYLRDYQSLDPRHGYKEDPDRPARGITSGTAQPRQQGVRDDLPRRDVVEREPAGRGAATREPQAQPSNPDRRGDRGGASSAPAPTTRERPSPSAGTGRAPVPADAPAASDRRPARGRP